MKNIIMTREGNMLRIIVDLSKAGEPSASGKTTIIASTQGNVDAIGCDGVKVGVNVFASPGYSIGNTRAEVGALSPSKRRR